MLSGRSGGGDFDGESSAPARARSAPAPAKAAATKQGGEDFEDFPGALNDEDDDLPF
jgi:single-strand DNA-binding protein